MFAQGREHRLVEITRRPGRCAGGESLDRFVQSRQQSGVRGSRRQIQCGGFLGARCSPDSQVSGRSGGLGHVPDESPGPAAGVNSTDGAERLPRFADRRRTDAEVLGQVTDGRQPISGLNLPRPDHSVDGRRNTAGGSVLDEGRDRLGRNRGSGGRDGHRHDPTSLSLPFVMAARRPLTRLLPGSFANSTSACNKFVKQVL